MAVRAVINKETLRYLRENIGVSFDYIESTAKFDKEKYSSWEDTSSYVFPTCNQAKTIAKCFRIPFAGLYMKAEDIKLKHIPKMYNMRTIQGGTSFDDSALHLAIFYLLNAYDLLISSKNELNEPLSSFSLTIKGSDVKHWAKTIRNQFQIDLSEQYALSSKRKFFLYIREKIENQGVFIQSFSDVDTDNARGVAIYNDIYPIIGVNNSDRYPAKSFTIIHELVHIYKHSSTMCNDMVNSFSSKQEEIFCNAVAGEVLVPHDAISILLNKFDKKTLTEENIKLLADTFSVSKEVISRRLLDIGRITKNEYDTFAIEFKRTYDLEREIEKEKRKAQGNKGIPRNIPRETIDKNSTSLCRTLFRGYGEGIYDRQDVARYLKIDQKHISGFLQEVSQWSN